jgi:SnoaL-like domain
MTTVVGVTNMLERLRDASNAHHPRRLASLFAEDYHSSQPLHPGRDFVGRAQVLQNWLSVFEGVPDFSSELVASAVNGETEWGESYCPPITTLRWVLPRVPCVDYRHHLRAVVAASAAPYGYTLTLWTAGAVTTHAQGLPSALDALLLLAGAVTGFAAVGAFAYGGINGVLAPRMRGEIRVWGGLHLPSVGSSILLVSVVTQVMHGYLVWLLVGFTATSTYLLVVGLQFWLATHRGHVPEPQNSDDP